jgi:predicted metal-binding protein
MSSAIPGGLRAAAAARAVSVRRSEWDGDLRVESRAGPGAARVELIVCVSCDPAGSDGSCDRAGERLLARLQDARSALGAAAPPLALGSMQCLWACRRGCAVHLRSPRRMGYVLGEFEPSAQAASLLLAFASLYCASHDGVVLLPQWPEGLRGHFLCRVPAVAAASEEVET